jgi:hypothetical protein
MPPTKTWVISTKAPPRACPNALPTLQTRLRVNGEPEPEPTTLYVNTQDDDFQAGFHSWILPALSGTAVGDGSVEPLEVRVALYENVQWIRIFGYFGYTSRYYTQDSLLSGNDDGTWRMMFSDGTLTKDGCNNSQPSAPPGIPAPSSDDEYR